MTTQDRAGAPGPAPGPGQVVSARAGTGDAELVDVGPGPYLVLSPHLDDAALSCGALLRSLAERDAVHVVTVFSAATAGPHTLSARAFLRQCGRDDAAALYRDRRTEDAAALTALGATWSHLGHADALFRRAEPRSWDRLLPPVLTHSYPTYRLHIARGRTSRRDRACLAAVADDLRRCVDRIAPGTVLAPMGIGSHVDHRIVAAVADTHLPHVVHYADQPYARTSPPDPELVRRRDLLPLRWSAGVVDKPVLLAPYVTQLAALFPHGVPADLGESYFVTRDRIRWVA